MEEKAITMCYSQKKWAAAKSMLGSIQLNASSLYKDLNFLTLYLKISVKVLTSSCKAIFCTI